MNPQIKNAYHYAAQFFATLALYAATLVASIHFGERMPKGPAQTAVALIPMIPVLLIVVIAIRQVRSLDEYMRQQALENVAIAAVITAGWTFTYGFLEGVGYPRLSMFSVWEVMGTIMGLLAMGRAIAGR